MKKILFILVAIAFAFASCEGPMGPAGLNGLDGEDGIDGEDGNVTCMDCHNTGNIQKVLEQFNQSVHSAGQIAVDYAGGRSTCARCHSSEGFIEYAANGTVAENITAPSAWECKTCHNIHSTFSGSDYAFRLGDPVEFLYDASVVVDFGNSNTCANCHQSRVAEPNKALPGATFAITSTHYGPHHGAQANVLNGTGFAEIEGTQTYGAAGSATHMSGAGCTGCHMGESTDTGTGGHTFNPTVDACKVCHTTATDFDYMSIQTKVEEDLNTLRGLLIGEGVVAGDDVNGYHPVVGTYDMVAAQAFFNWTGLDEDRSLGVHNPKYVKALLNNSIEALELRISTK